MIQGVHAKRRAVHSDDRGFVTEVRRAIPFDWTTWSR